MKKVFRIFGIVAVIFILVAAILASMNQKTPNAEKVWDDETTIGDLEAENYFIIYSDLACPYCVAFENAMIEHEDQLKKYIESNDVLIEVRLSDFLYEYGQVRSPESLYGAVATYCAKREGKFWDYYNKAITKVWNEYFKNEGKAAFTKFNELKKDYWIKLGEGIGLSDEFESCVENDETKSEVQEVAAKSAKMIDGMPYFKFNKYVASGFDLSWGYDYVLMYFEAGLEKK